MPLKRKCEKKPSIASIVEAIFAAVIKLAASIKASNTKTRKQLGDLMADFNEVKQGIADNTAQTQKAFGEIRAKLDELIAAQPDVDAAVAAALAADAEADAADFSAKMDELQTALSAQKEAVQALDDIVPDAAPVE